MKIAPEQKKKMLVANGAYWFAAILIPPLLRMMPTSKPPKILPFFTLLFLVFLAIASTAMWSQFIDSVGKGEGE